MDSAALTTAPLWHEAADAGHRAFYGKLTVGAVALGTVFRTVQYLWRESFWRDEVALLVNITGKSWMQLLTSPLDYGQAAPPLFLLSMKALGSLLGNGEYGLRLLPLLMAVLALGLFARLAWELLRPAAATLAVALLGVSDVLIGHAADAKQYSGDLCLATLLLLLAIRTAAVASGRRFVILSIVAAAGIWFSHPAILLFAGVSVVLGWVLMRSGARGMPPWMAGNALFALSFVGLYVTSIRPQSGSQYLHSFWSDHFVPWSQPLRIPLWLGEMSWELLTSILQPHDWLGWVIPPLMIAGVILWWNGPKRMGLALCAAPILACLAAAATGQYPFGGKRVHLFLLPGVVLMTAAGLDWLRRQRPHWRGQATAILFVLLIIPSLLNDGVHLFAPRLRSHLRPVVEYVRSRRQPGEPIYVGKHLGELLWYWPQAPGPFLVPKPVQHGAANWYWFDVPAVITVEDPLREAPAETFWYILGDKPASLRRKKQPQHEAFLQVAREVERFAVPGGMAIRFQRASSN
jgi:hypothetical protein